MLADAGAACEGPLVKVVRRKKWYSHRFSPERYASRLTAARTNKSVCPYGDRLPLNGAKRQGVIASQRLTATSLGKTPAEPCATESEQN